MVCPNCGTTHANQIRFCTACGTSLLHSSSTPTAKSSGGISSKNMLIMVVALVVTAAAVYLIFSSNKKNNMTSTTDADTSQSTPGKYPQATDRILTPDDLIPMKLQELRIMRNEIFARHGYIFQSQEMIRHFNNQSWYQPRYNEVTSMFSETEKKNIELIKIYEKLFNEYDVDI